jgi:hypothetical protein
MRKILFSSLLLMFVHISGYSQYKFTNQYKKEKDKTRLDLTINNTDNDADALAKIAKIISEEEAKPNSEDLVIILKKLYVLRDSLEIVQRANNIRLNRTDNNSDLNNALLFNAKNTRAFFEIVYNDKSSKLSLLQQNGVNFNTNSINMVGEIIRGTFGVVNLSLGMMVDNTGGKVSAEDLRTKIANLSIINGGNFAIEAKMPLYYTHSKTDRFHHFSQFKVRGIFNIPQTDSLQIVDNASFGFYFEQFFQVHADNNDKFKIFFKPQVTIQYMDKNFREGLKSFNDDFLFYVQASAGCLIDDKVQIQFTAPLVGSHELFRFRHVLFGVSYLL